MAKWDKKLVWERAEQFVTGYPHSDTYHTLEARLHLWKSLWPYLENNPNYGFNCSYVKGLHLPGTAFECTDCIGTEPEKLHYSQAIITREQFVQLDIPPRESLLHPIIKEQSITLIYGPRGVGKTWFAQSLMDAIAYGTQFGPWESGRKVPCLYLEGEMPAQDVIERLGYFKYPEKNGETYIYSDGYANTIGLPKANLSNPKWQEQIKEELLRLNVKLWVVDNLASLAPGMDEMSKQEYDPVNQFFLDLRFAGVATVFLHHAGKLGQQRGTSAHEDNIDSVIKLAYPADYSQEQGARFNVIFEKARLRTKELPFTKPMEFQLSEDEFNTGVWTHRTTLTANRIRILQMLDEGYNQKEISENLEVDKGYVSKVRKKAIENNQLTNKNKLTQTGYKELFGDEEGNI
jgi:putative DNA primase/helicase